MMTLDYVGDEGAMLYAQVGQHPLARTTETSPERSSGHLSCLSTRPPDLATATAAQPGMACVRPSIVPFLYILQARGGDAIPEVALWANRSFCGRYEPTSRGTTLQLGMQRSSPARASACTMQRSSSAFLNFKFPPFANN